jgi:hypothetical protein
MPINFNVSAEEHALALAIAQRFVALINRPDVTVHYTAMDVVATHANGTPLRLADLLAADDFDFAHDVGGIRRHLDRTTGRLGGCFVPRFAVRQGGQ